MGFVSAFDQILEGFDSPAKDDIFSAYVKSLDEDPSLYRSDAVKLETACKELGSDLDALLSDENQNGNLLKSSLDAVAESASNGHFYYTKFFAIGLFRVLELTGFESFQKVSWILLLGFKDPKALERLVKKINVSLEFVNRDLKLYKKVLTRLSAAKEMMKEVTEREKKKSAEREAAASQQDASKGDIPESTQT